MRTFKCHYSLSLILLLRIGICAATSRFPHIKHFSCPQNRAKVRQIFQNVLILIRMCYPFVDGNADGVSAAVQAEHINPLAQIAGSALANLEPLALLAGKPTHSPLGLDLDSNPDTFATFASTNVNDRHGPGGQSISQSAPLATRALHTRQSDAGP
ncbi:hypothetical protein FRC06_011113 [Ceratobasidium sp. 370]|nr:hypothetical protein FRC06_011113 [Ceratobasidium sp. 370]